MIKFPADKQMQFTIHEYARSCTAVAMASQLLQHDPQHDPVSKAEAVELLYQACITPSMELNEAFLQSGVTLQSQEELDTLKRLTVWVG